MTEANKNVFKSASKWVTLIMLPALLMGWYFDEPFINGIYDYGYYYLFFIFFSGCSDGIMDTLQFHFSISRFSKFNHVFWNPAISWKNKYINKDPKNGRRWIPVIFTDAWHLFKALRTTFLVLGVVFFTNQDERTWVPYLLCYGMYKWGFNLCYEYLKREE